MLRLLFDVQKIGPGNGKASDSFDQNGKHRRNGFLLCDQEKPTHPDRKA
jgi:hypothetical protein